MSRKWVAFAMLSVFAAPVTVACGELEGALVARPPERNRSGQVVSPGQVEALEIQLADCFDNSGSDEVETVTVVPCSEPHAFEVFHSFDLTDGPYPGAEAMTSLWMNGCLSQFEAFVGTPFEDSVLDISAIYPTELTWNRFGDREIVCSVTSVDGQPLTGSARNSRV